MDRPRSLGLGTLTVIEAVLRREGAGVNLSVALLIALATTAPASGSVSGPADIFADLCNVT
ncbi:hypothetical protein [Kribbella catacumbae]|uniref:hypothetical protein n=1 Tax=Kribbella catacumbae TaxID=460086 RepID=UPI0003665F80|nr:hypothetical protein [Kribbella catacumbae]